MKKGHHMSMSRKLEIVRTVLNKSKGVTMLHGDKLIQHVASSITLYEKYTPDEKDTKEVGSL
jgi:hypothetical protein